jgi:hypothetical protein
MPVSKRRNRGKTRFRLLGGNPDIVLDSGNKTNDQDAKSD